MALPGFAANLGGAAGRIVGMLQFGVNVKNGNAIGGLAGAIGKLRNKFIEFGVTTIFLDRLLQSFSRAWDTLNNTLGVDRMTDKSAQLARMAQGLGTSTERLSAFVGISERYGAEINDIPDLIATMQDKLKDFAEGNKTVADNFKKTGLLPKDFIGKGPLDRFLILVDGIQKLDEADRAAFLSRTFGDDLGRKFAPMVVKGSKAIREEMMAMVMTGQVLSESQISMGATVRAYMMETRGIFDGFRNSMTMVFLPSVLKAMDTLSDFFMSLAITARQHVDEMSNSLKRLYDFIGTFRIFKFLGGDIEDVFAGLQAVILTVAAASAMWLVGMLASAAPFLAIAAAIGLALQDIYVYMQGGDSLIGRFLGSDIGIIKTVINWIKLIIELIKMLYAVSSAFLADIVGSPLLRVLIDLVFGAIASGLAFIIGLMMIFVGIIRLINAGFYIMVATVEGLIAGLTFVVGLLTKIFAMRGLLPMRLADGLLGTSISMARAGAGSLDNAATAVSGAGMMEKFGRASTMQSPNFMPTNNIWVNNTVNSVNAPQTALAVLNDSMTRVQEKVSYP